MINVVHRMTGKTALVTGVASGIGTAIAQRLAVEGARVALADLNEPGAASVADAIRKAGGRAIGIRLDVTSESEWEAVLARIHAKWGRLDIAVNCAGIAFAKPITELELADCTTSAIASSSPWTMPAPGPSGWRSATRTCRTSPGR
jgi:3-hydroxybutyrate dehydrogenase